MPLRLLLAEDYRLIAEGLEAFLCGQGYAVVGAAADGRQAVELAESLRPDVAILDVSLPLLNGIDAAATIHQRCPDTRTILLTVHSEEPYVLAALRAGVGGYVLKKQAGADLIRAIDEVTRGAVYLSPGVSGALVEAFRKRRELPDDPLTAREREVLQLVAEGRTTKEVASILGVSVKTADSHRTNLMQKLGIHETAGLVRYAIRRGLVQP